jgi:hypothetical protein
MRVKLRFVVGVTAIWLAAVAGVSATAWLAIDRAGREVTSASVSALRPASIGTAATATASGQGASGTGPTTKPSASTTPKPTAPKTSNVAPSPSQSPSQASTDTGSVTSTPVRDRTVTVVGGQVSVRCIGADLTLRIAQPDNGWRVELDRSDSGDVQVTFKGGDSEASPETQVTAACSAGTPVFTVHNKSSSDT